MTGTAGLSASPGQPAEEPTPALRINARTPISTPRWAAASISSPEPAGSRIERTQRPARRFAKQTPPGRSASTPDAGSGPVLRTGIEV
jgi:hypothetical protein